MSRTHFIACTIRSLLTAIGRHPPSYYAELYRKHNLTGGHVIKLGPKNDEAAREALNTWPDYMQVGGGITSDNAQSWLDAGASKVSPAILPPLCQLRL